MKIAVLSDAHGRIDRLKPALEEIRSSQVDEIWSLGDMVGYGGSPKDVVDLLRQNCQLLICGNHDKACSGQLEWFYEGIPEWLKKTIDQARRDLSQEDISWLKTTPAQMNRHGIACYHGNTKDPVFGFNNSEEDFWWHLRSQEAPISFVGHSHRPLAIGLKEEQLLAMEPSDGDELDLSKADRWVLNPGTVGLQQTEPTTDSRPGWMLVDLDANRVTWHRLG